jgi:formylglycine-generating enzyme required for sulfatase activity
MSLVDAIVDALAAGQGASRQRLELSEALGHLGDPRLRSPTDEDYWCAVGVPYEDVAVARYPVTNAEYVAWVEAGGYDDKSAWTDAGRAWLASCDNPWHVLAQREDAAPFVVANQPVVGVTWFEASAYARAHDSRLLRTDERVWVTRGEERRPYPWGSPFGEGNANTREECLERPCGVGLFLGDRTPDGVHDLAGNVAEWSGDEPVVGDERLVHPGCWEQPSMAAWAKALIFVRPEARRTSLGFRLGRDVG